jgi:hypothetical protein
VVKQNATILDGAVIPTGSVIKEETTFPEK